MDTKEEKNYLKACIIINAVGCVLLLFHFSNKITLELIWLRLIVIQSMIFSFGSLLMIFRNRKKRSKSLVQWED